MKSKTEIVDVTCSTSKWGRCVLRFERTVTHFKGSSALIADPWCAEVVITTDKDTRFLRLIKPVGLSTWQAEVWEKTKKPNGKRVAVVARGVIDAELAWQFVARRYWEVEVVQEHWTHTLQVMSKEPKC